MRWRRTSSSGWCPSGRGRGGGRDRRSAVWREAHAIDPDDRRGRDHRHPAMILRLLDATRPHREGPRPHRQERDDERLGLGRPAVRAARPAGLVLRPAHRPRGQRVLHRVRSPFAAPGARRRLCRDRRSPRPSGPSSPSGAATTASSAASATFAAADLPDGEVEVRVDWSSVNYKDALATIADGKVARISPLIPGIDLAGEVVASARSVVRGRARRSWPTATTSASPGTAATASTRGFPAGYVVPLPAGPRRPRGDGDRDGRVHGRDVRRRAGGARAPRRATARCS